MDLVAQVDAIAGTRGRSRFIEEATRAAIRREQLRLMHAIVAGSLRAEDYPQWATSEAVVAWVRESRAEERRDSDARPIEFVQPGPDVAVRAGAWRADARRRGLHLSLPDALIAAAADASGAAVLTRNVRDFALTPVRIETY